MTEPKQPSTLHTKLMPPRLQNTVIPRHNLLARLDEGLTKKLILVTAPTGFGKTTLLGSWLATRKFASAWVTLDSNDNDPVRFWTYVITALRKIDPTLGKNVLAALLTSRPVSLHVLLTPLINDLTRLSQPGVLILEDYHVIASPEIHATVSFLLQHLPANLHLVLATRSAPALPLAILRARDELVDLDASHLRFSLAETTAFLHAAVQIELPSNGIASLHDQTEGWAAGLRLAARSLQDQRDPLEAERFIQTFSGAQHSIADYLIQEVFESQAEDVQSFLIKTCFFNRLTGSLCDAIACDPGIPVGNGEATLEQLERENLFIIQLQDAGGRAWYRYNPLFAASLQGLARRRLGAAGVRSLFEQASGWYEANGFNDEAVETALTARLFERAARLIERFIEFHSLTEVYTLTRWLEQFPTEQIQGYPKLCFTYAQIILFTTDRYALATAARLDPLLQHAETAWQTANDYNQLGMLHAFRGLAAWWRGDLVRAFEWAQLSIEEISEQEVTYRGISLLILSYQALQSGQIWEAQNRALESRALMGAAQNHHGILAALQMLSEVFFWQGEMEQADQLNRQILAEAAEAVDGDSMLDDQGIASLSSANIAYEQNELETAKNWAARALELAQRRGNELLRTQAAIRLAYIQAAQGNTEGAEARLKSLVAALQNQAWLRLVHEAQAWLAIRKAEPGSLKRWLSIITVDQPNLLAAQMERAAFTRARLWIAAGQPRAALAELDRWQEKAASQGRVRSQVEALCIEALAYLTHLDQDRACQTLLQALEIGQTKGFRRLFLDEGAKMAALLQVILPRLSSRALSLYATALLHSFSPDLVSDGATDESVQLFEPLSQQELRVMRYLVAGLSNTEIASELTVSKNTVKSQVQSIYRKLNVNSRDEARHLAQELRLL